MEYSLRNLGDLHLHCRIITVLSFFHVPLKLLCVVVCCWHSPLDWNRHRSQVKLLQSDKSKMILLHIPMGQSNVNNINSNWLLINLHVLWLISQWYIYNFDLWWFYGVWCMMLLLYSSDASFVSTESDKAYCFLLAHKSILLVHKASCHWYVTRWGRWARSCRLLSLPQSDFLMQNNAMVFVLWSWQHWPVLL